MSHKELILAVFPDESAADAAAESLKDSGITLGDAMGILVLDEDGKLKVDKVGARSWGVGAGVGTILLFLGPAVLGVGIIGGTLAGGLHHKKLGMSDEEKDRLHADLAGGKAALGIMSAPPDSETISAMLTQLGGELSSYTVPEQVLAETPPAEG